MQDSFVSYLNKSKQINEPQNSLSFPRRLQKLNKIRIDRSPSLTCSNNRPIEFEVFSKYCQQNSKNSNYGFGEEFDLLNQISQTELYIQEQVIGVKGKNRYMNITPCK